MKKVFIYSIILLLIGTLLFINKRRVYNYARNVLISINTNRNSAQKENGDFVWGIDISHHQKSIDWNLLVDKNKPDFIFFKCTEGQTHQDTKYQLYKREADKRGIINGAYHFFSYQSPGRNQAINFIKHSNLKEGDLYPVLDIEYKKNRPSDKKIRKQVKEFCEVIKSKYRVNPIIYCEYDYYNNILKPDFDGYNYWISNLYREPKGEYVFWQYTDRGNVVGIGKIDNNRLNSNKKLSDFILKSK